MKRIFLIYPPNIVFCSFFFFLILTLTTFHSKIETILILSNTAALNLFWINSQVLNVSFWKGYLWTDELVCHISCSPSRHPQASYVWRWRDTGCPRGRWSQLWTLVTFSPPQSNSTSATLPGWCLQGRKTMSGHTFCHLLLAHGRKFISFHQVKSEFPNNHRLIKLSLSDRNRLNILNTYEWTSYMEN